MHIPFVIHFGTAQFLSLAYIKTHLKSVKPLMKTFSLPIKNAKLNDNIFSTPQSSNNYIHTNKYCPTLSFTFLKSYIYI